MLHPTDADLPADGHVVPITQISSSLCWGEGAVTLDQNLLILRIRLFRFTFLQVLS
jgi:hypothetical protein